MATRSAPNPPATRRIKRSTPGSSSRAAARARPANGSNHRPVCGSLPSANLAGRPVEISIDVPAGFDAPLAPHHKLVGRWAAARESSACRYTRQQARARIERVFEAAVLDILGPFELAQLRVGVLGGEGK